MRGEESSTITVTETRHGPIIAGDPAQGQALALKSVQLFDTDLSLNCLLPMLKAPTLADFQDTGRGWGVIDHSVVGADRDGHIGYLVRAIVPERDPVNGWLPVPGWTTDHEWRGLIPFERMPREMDPDRGFIVTANNRLVEADHPDYLLTDCHPSTRASRVAKRIERTADLTPGDMVEILRDTDSAPAREITSRILAAGTTEGAALRATLAGWDGRMDAGLTAPTIYYAIRQEMTRMLGQLSGLSDATKPSCGQSGPRCIASRAALVDVAEPSSGGRYQSFGWAGLEQPSSARRSRLWPMVQRLSLGRRASAGDDPPAEPSLPRRAGRRGTCQPSRRRATGTACWQPARCR